MKRFAYYIACCTLVVLCACTHDDTDDVIPAGNGKIMIQASLDDMAITRAFDGETAKERTVKHIDVFAVDPEGNIDYYERNTAGNNNGTNEDGSGVLTLNVARRAKIGDAFVFAEGVAYKFYLVANSRTPVEAIKDSNGLKDGFKTEDDLKKWIFDDIIEIKEGVIQTNLHLTGTTLGETNDTDVDNTNRQPQTFLMDAVAKFGSDESVVVNPTTGGESSLTLSAVFKRAAAKILVNIKQGPDVVFHKYLSVKLKDKDGKEAEKETTQYAKYYFYKLPASTFVLPNDQQLVSPYLITTAPMDAPQAVNPDKPGTEQVFKWSENIKSDDDVVDVQVLGYAYAHEWSDVDLTNETSLILNIPMYYKENDTTNPNRDENGMAPAPNSWYKVPLSKDKIFERNKCYVVNITINAVGATNKSDAIMLRNIEYETLPWQAVGIDVGNDENRPAYLELNTDLVEIYNANFDNTSLSFSSSSAIRSITLKDVYKQNDNGTFTSETDSYYAYYINKFGVKTSLSETIRNTISATAEKNVLNGAISILSPIVPAKSAEIEKLILEQLGPAPTAPTLTEPTYDGTIPTAPTVVPAAAEPDIEDEEYTKPESITNGNWSDIWYSDNYGWTYNGNNANQSTERTRTRTRTNTLTEYRYEKNEDDTYTFLKRTARQEETETQTSTRQSTRNPWGAIVASTTISASTYSEWTSDTSTQASWNAAVTAYKSYQQYLIDKAKYEADMAVLNEKPEYQQYLADKAAYDAALADYNAQLADYNERAAAIREAAKGEETHYNTIRYLEFEVENEQGMKATFRVMQYPVIYITHVMGYYSYRDDFNGTTWEKRGNPSSINNCDWSSGKWTYTHNTSDRADAGIFRSKVYNPGGSTGNYPIDYYYWGSNGRSFYNAGSLSNPRMYHVRVTATSDTYIVGRPRFIDDNGNPSSDIENGFTDDSDENAKLVSPSFMLASQLGATQSPGTDDEDMPVAADHCRQYVEVADDGTEYHDWRLPTAAEIDIIIKLQNNSQAMDEVLSGVSYWSASGIKATGVSGASGTGRIRCVRDAY